MPRFGGGSGRSSRGFGASGAFPGGRGSAVDILEYAAEERIVAQYLYEHAGVPTDGTNGTYAHIAPPGALLIDTDNKTLYQNTNTQASPTWTVRSASGGGGGPTRVYQHVCDGIETDLAIPFPAEGEHAVLLVHGTAFGSPGQFVDFPANLVSVALQGEALLRVEWPFFRTATVAHYACVDSGGSLQSGVARFGSAPGNFNLAFTDSSDINPQAPPAGTVVEVWVS